ncbi:MAG: fibronectin type III domain-containing protein, partial [Flavobacteriales bacterium]|nr:fibronectin type III domain-containing protein [Flavobacteriales bacterium]
MNSRPYSTSPPGRTSWWRKLAVLPAILALFGAPAANAQTMVQVGTGTATNSFLPIYSCYGYNYSQQIYEASEITAAGGFAGSVSKLRFYYNAGGTSTTLWNSWTVWMGNTGLSNFTGTTGWVPVGSMTQVFSGTITPVAANWLELTLSTPFIYTGGNIVIAVDENTPSYSCTATWRSYTVGAAAGPRSLLYYSDGTNPDPNAPPTANYNNTTVRAQFQMDITSLSGCTGTTAPGATTGPSSVCPGANFTVGITNTTSGSGVTYAWERDNGGGYLPFGTNAAIQTVTGGQTTATSYRCTVTCTGFGPLTSTPLAVGMNGYLGCYCIPSTNSCLGGDHITNVTIGTINNTTAQCITTATYSDYTAISTTLNQTANVPISVSINYGGTEYVGAWIDYDQSGSYSNTEWLTFSPGINMGAYWLFNGTASIPGGAVLGETRMRVRSRYSTSILPTDACTDGFSYGETEDYKIFIAGPPACVAPTVSSSNIGTNSADISWTCAGCTGPYYVEYGLTGFTPGTGATANGGTLWTGGPVAGSPVTVTGLANLSGYTVYVRQDCGGGNYSANTGTSFTTTPDCAGSPVIVCGATNTTTFASGNGIWNVTACGFSTPGKEAIYILNAVNAGIYTLNLTGGDNTYVDWYWKSTAGTCDATGWTCIDDIYSTGSYNFTISTPGTYYMLADPEGTAAITKQWNIACPLPCATPQSPFASNVTSASALINWTCTGCTGSNFIVEYGLNGFALGTGTQITSATSPATISGLIPTTAYQAYVYQDCNNVGDGLSNPSSVVSFTTLALPPANDLCVDAIQVTCGAVINSTNNAATADGLPSQSGTFPLNIETGVWYKYVGDDQQVTLDLCASTLD